MQEKHSLNTRVMFLMVRSTSQWNIFQRELMVELLISYLKQGKTVLLRTNISVGNDSVCAGKSA